MSSNSRFLLFALALSAPISPARAQNKPASPAALPPVVTTGARGEQFILGPDDVISLSVANHPEMSADELKLSSTGRVALPVLGPLTIRGKTLEQARGAIAAAYKSQLRNPKVSITLVRARPRQATVLGAVARPGAIDLQPGWRVSEALANVGGLNNDLVPEDVQATLKRLSGAPVALDIATIYRAPENKANPRMAVGDVISIVPIAQITVTLNGDVGTVGPQSSRRAPKLLAAIGRASGLKFAPEDTDVSLLRGGNIIALDVAAATANPNGAANIELRDGDLLSVQGVRLSVNVIADENLVKAPGNYQLEGRSSFMRAISAAGGLAAPVGQVVASVRRGNQVIPVDMERAIYEPSADIALQNNDIILLKPVEGPRVRLIGEVKAPEAYNFKKGIKVLEAVSEAGGLNLAPEASKIAVIRTLEGGRQQSFNVDAGLLWRGNDLSQNMTLQDGDLVLVNSVALRSISVLGEVEKPDSYELKAGDGLTEILLRAGGPTKRAGLKRVTLYRKNGTSQVVDYANFGTGAVPEVKLEDGDRVQVPFNPNQVSIIGAVEKPDYYAIPENGTLNVGEALSSARILPNAKTNDIVLLRPAPKSAAAPDGYTSQRIKFKDARNGNIAETIGVILQPGDVLYVPEGGNGRSGLSTAIAGLGALSVLRGF